MKPKRIGIDARMMGKINATGIGSYIERIVDGVTKTDLENEYVIFLKSETAKTFKPSSANIRVVINDCHWYGLCEQTKFLLALMKENLDLVHFPHFNVPIFYKRPFVVTIHDLTPFYFPGHKMTSRLRKAAYNLVFKTAVKKSKQILSVSGYTAGEIVKLFGIAKEKITVTHLGVEKRFFSGQKYDKMPSDSGIQEVNKPYIFFVGAWRDHKNIPGLIRAFELLRNKHNQDIGLVIGGAPNPNYEGVSNALENLDEKTRSAIFTPGFINDERLPDLYANASVYVTPSFLEGFGLNGLEAMATGTPVACSNVGSLPEVYGDSALYFDPSSAKDMAEKINSILINDSLRQELIKKGLQKTAEYDWKRTVAQTIDCYRSVLNTSTIHAVEKDPKR